MQNNLCNIAAILSLALMVGCSDGGVARQNLTGKVTHAGKPVPMGRIMFQPDTTKGNSGPQGYADIEDGGYNTDNFGKGSVTGPQIVTIIGFEKPNDSSGQSSPKQLFPRYVTKVDISDDGEPLDFDVPAAVP